MNKAANHSRNTTLSAKDVYNSSRHFYRRLSEEGGPHTLAHTVYDTRVVLDCWGIVLSATHDKGNLFGRFKEER